MCYNVTSLTHMRVLNTTSCYHPGFCLAEDMTIWRKGLIIRLHCFYNIHRIPLKYEGGEAKSLCKGYSSSSCHSFNNFRRERQKCLLRQRSKRLSSAIPNDDSRTCFTQISELGSVKVYFDFFFCRWSPLSPWLSRASGLRSIKGVSSLEVSQCLRRCWSYQR